MSNIHLWSRLSSLQIGRYAEYYVKMEFTLHGFDVYSAEVDDKGIDFVIRKEPHKYYDVQVKSVRGLTYIFFPKAKFSIEDPFLLAAIVLFQDGKLPDIYLIPSTTWQKPNALFVGHDYVGKKSPPEWGINLSEKNLPLLQAYKFEETVKSF